MRYVPTHADRTEGCGFAGHPPSATGAPGCAGTDRLLPAWRVHSRIRGPCPAGLITQTTFRCGEPSDRELHASAADTARGTQYHECHRAPASHPADPV